jgi:hypothetical protein
MSKIVISCGMTVNGIWERGLKKADRTDLRLAFSPELAEGTVADLKN